jgi:hypothetical protein
MKCPILQAGAKSDPEGDCLHEDCGWWDDEKGRCAVITIATKLYDIAWNLDEIRQRQ